ncbi:MAG TPA: UDP-N-acetylmuramoyl-L-alanyl-D-glutamate--2,6-diaminopimelate ligase [Nitrospirales bacterium]|nr:UDP-N-acetylmuramoyl-L-alanyl-D-glutamate--2,6-diaminopimelate ligase [Nitrospirales bacterium]
MRLDVLLEGVEPLVVSGAANPDISAICDDSRDVKPGSLFVAIKGFQSDGNRFLADAASAGAVSVASEKPLAGFTEVFPNIAAVQVHDSRHAIGILARNFYGNPSSMLTMYGVTGTNGKTTVGYLVKTILETAGQKSGLIGTIGYEIGNQRLTTSHTTPSAAVLQSLLNRMVQQGVKEAVIEVTSHALALARISGCLFDTVVFTNLTRDHLDFHGDLETYFNTKLRLFSLDLLKLTTDTSTVRAVINLDDPYGDRVRDACGVSVWGYAIDSDADIRAENIVVTFEGTSFTAQTPVGSFLARSALVGRHNVYNILAAIGVGLSRGCSIKVVQQGIASLRCVPGRFEKIDEGQGYGVVVDYAHTGDALDKLLNTARSLTAGKIITVFGCGGDRDQGKRSVMGIIAARLSDLVIVTSDNPRSEDPDQIIRDVMVGIAASENTPPCEVIPDRKEAIVTAIQSAQPGDLVVIAGKGHEDYQIVGDRRLHFDDRRVAREAIVSAYGPLHD